MLGIQQKKGDPDKLCGRLVAYARISPSASKEHLLSFAWLEHQECLQLIKASRK